MDTHTQPHIQPIDRTILHVAPDQPPTTQPAHEAMHQALQRTGRTVLTRCDLYQAMGALVGSKKSTPIEAIFISAAGVAHDDGEFFEIVPRSFPELAIYVYGDSVGPANRVIQQSTATRIDPETVGSLFDRSNEPNEPSRTPPQAESFVDASMPITEIATEPSPDAPAPDAPSALEQRLLRSLDEVDALQQSESAGIASNSPSDPPANSPAEKHESDHSPVAEADHDGTSPSGAAPPNASPTEPDDDEPRPPVPWNPSLARPARTPPNQDTVLEIVDDVDDPEDQNPATDDRSRRSDESDADQPLLTREELDALLRDEQDSAGELEHRL